MFAQFKIIFGYMFIVFLESVKKTSQILERVQNELGVISPLMLGRYSINTFDKELPLSLLLQNCITAECVGGGRTKTPNTYHHMLILCHC